MNQTEGLQDFRRRQEGHLIIADDAWLPKKTLETFGVNRQDLVNGSEHDVLKKLMNPCSDTRNKENKIQRNDAFSILFD